MIACSPADISEKPEDGDGMFLQNVGKFLPDHMMSYPKTQQSWRDTNSNPPKMTTVMCLYSVPIHYAASEQSRSLTLSLAHCIAENSRAATDIQNNGPGPGHEH